MYKKENTESLGGLSTVTQISFFFLPCRRRSILLVLKYELLLFTQFLIQTAQLYSCCNYSNPSRSAFLPSQLMNRNR
jgi:hypothetical protein